MNQQTSVHTPPKKPLAATIIGLILIVAVIGFLYFHSKGSGHEGSSDQAPPSVAVATVTKQDLSSEVPIPAEFRPYQATELHAMVTGYVSQMNVDIGDRVKKDQTLATLEVPELPDQLRNAAAIEQQMESEATNSHLLYTRLEQVYRQNPKLVAQQELDTAKSKDASSAAAVEAAKATVEKFQTLCRYTNILAPFDGVVTKRSANSGDLVQAGTSSDRSMPVVRVSDNYRLRLDFPVSVDYVKDVHLGDPVTVRVDSLGGKSFTSKITRFTGQVNDETRTMTTELQVENPDLEIVPGMYAVAMFRFANRTNTLTVPTEAVTNPKDPIVAVVNTNHEVELRPVKLGIEGPDKYEITEGLSEGELVVLGNHSLLRPGQKVAPKIVTRPAIP